MGRYKLWTPEEDAYLREVFAGEKKPPLEEVADALGRPEGGVRDRARALGITWSKNGQKSRWTPQEDAKLEVDWGQRDIERLSSSLHRSLAAVKQRAYDLGLGPARENASWVLFRTVVQAIYNYPDDTLGGHVRSKRKVWLKRGCPIFKKKISRSQAYWVVTMAAWWKWAQQHQPLLDFSAFEYLALGPEPDWVAGKRKADIALRRKQGNSMSNKPWTQDEICKLKDYAGTRKYTAGELAGLLGRTASSIQNMGKRQGITHLFRVADPQDRVVWTKPLLDHMAILIHEETSWLAIAEKLGVPENLCYSRARTTYGTMQLDKLRTLVKKGDWGAVTPSWAGPTISVNKRQRAVKEGISKLLDILTIPSRLEVLEDFDQHSQCENWDPWRGCTLGEAGCEVCTGFVRILPVFCSECGAMFTQRGERNKKDHLCPACSSGHSEETTPIEVVREDVPMSKPENEEERLEVMILTGKSREELAAAFSCTWNQLRYNLSKKYGTSSLTKIGQQLIRLPKYRDVV